MREGRVLSLDAAPAYPPLTLLDVGGQWCETTTVPLHHGDRLLLHTYGLMQARDERGRVYPLAERAAALSADDPALTLENIQADLLDHVADGLSLPTTLLLAHLERSAPRPASEQGAAQWTGQGNG
jgi:hypothetical protein